MTEVKIRNASTIILIRDAGDDPKVLMGQRGSKAAFMPNKFVFPGGAVDVSDAQVPFPAALAAPCHSRLQGTSDLPASTFIAAAIRELWEEAGVIFGEPGKWDATPPAGWADFADSGHIPHAQGIYFAARAITPPGRPRRFDARFFLADAKQLASDPDDFSLATDELSHLQWIPVDKARSFDLPPITEVILDQVSNALPRIGAPKTVPFFNNINGIRKAEQIA
ncbi:MAG: NUDIX hydrolase [Marinosulfonomonas sp.]|nr:NUDIX hydrolase [Marinosulfonomonas sp.]